MGAASAAGGSATSDRTAWLALAPEIAGLELGGENIGLSKNKIAKHPARISVIRKLPKNRSINPTIRSTKC